jgi:aryl-alcohol dehydrogenase-like predicted oxidoreductase
MRALHLPSVGKSSTASPDMASRAFGKTGWHLGAIGLSCWEFGGAKNRAQLEQNVAARMLSPLTQEEWAAVEQAIAAGVAA